MLVVIEPQGAAAGAKEILDVIAIWIPIRLATKLGK
jgi:hypothetical protein